MLAIGLTDLDWFDALSSGPVWHEVNFWTPTPWSVRALHDSDRFYFLLKAPVRKVGGYGSFLSYEEMPASAAWNRFGPANGVSDLASLVTKVTGYAGRRSGRSVLDTDPTIGCIVLRAPVFLDARHFRSPDSLDAPVPRHVVKFKTFPELDRLDIGEDNRDVLTPFTLVEGLPPGRRTTQRIDRPGQRRFRDRVLQAYGFACAVTGETCREVLEAAHIQPYIDERSNDVRNGIALRADLHALFDAGLITVDDAFRLYASAHLSSPALSILKWSAHQTANL